MGYFSDLDLRMKEAGLSPKRIEKQTPKCYKCGEHLQVLDFIGGNLFRYYCANPKCERNQKGD